MKSLCIAFLVVFAAVGCNPQRSCYRNRGYQSITEYKVKADRITQGGVKVDASGVDVDLAKIDSKVDALEKCLGKPINRTCFVVKIANDSYRSKCSGQVLFPCRMPNSVCKRKIEAGGIEILPDSPCTLEKLPCAECPCHCAATVQDNRIIVTTPDLRLFTAELARLVTNFNNVWSEKARQQGVTKCVQSQ